MRRSSLILALFLVVVPFGAVGQQLNQSTLKTRAVTQDGFEKLTEQVIGAWAMTWDTYGLSGAEHLVANGETYTGSDGTVYLVVERAFTTSGLGLLDFDEQYNDWVLLLDSSTSYYRLFIFTVHGVEAAGLSWLYQKDSSPSGAGLWMRGFLFADAEDVPVSTAAKEGRAVSPESADRLHAGAAEEFSHYESKNAARAFALERELDKFLLDRAARQP